MIDEQSDNWKPMKKRRRVKAFGEDSDDNKSLECGSGHSGVDEIDSELKSEFQIDQEQSNSDITDVE